MSENKENSPLSEPEEIRPSKRLRGVNNNNTITEYFKRIPRQTLFDTNNMNGNASSSSTPIRDGQIQSTSSGSRISPPYQSYQPGFLPNIHPGFQPVGLGHVGYFPQYNYIPHTQMQIQQTQPINRRVMSQTNLSNDNLLQSQMVQASQPLMGQQNQIIVDPRKEYIPTFSGYSQRKIINRNDRFKSRNNSRYIRSDDKLFVKGKDLADEFGIWWIPKDFPKKFYGANRAASMRGIVKLIEDFNKDKDKHPIKYNNIDIKDVCYVKNISGMIFFLCASKDAGRILANIPKFGLTPICANIEFECVRHSAFQFNVAANSITIWFQEATQDLPHETILKGLFPEIKERSFNNWQVIDTKGKSQKIKGVEGLAWDFLISDDLWLFVEEKTLASDNFTIVYKDNLLARFKAIFSQTHFNVNDLCVTQVKKLAAKLNKKVDGNKWRGCNNGLDGYYEIFDDLTDWGSNEDVEMNNA